MTIQQKQQLERQLIAFQEQITAMHKLRGTINECLSRVHGDNLTLALTQKKNLRQLKKEYEKLTKLKDCLPPQDAAPIFEMEYNYILTIENILTSTQALKANADVGQENLDAIRDGLEKFYDGLRAEMLAASYENPKQ